ncbi:MAG: response regulator [Leptospirillia bacterium]
MEPNTHILVVDDDREIRALVSGYLEKNGFRVTAAADGRAMRRALSDHRIDMVLLDLMLPGEDGLTLCRDLRAAGGNVPIIMLTARTEETDRIVGLEMGADDYVAKPFSPRELLARIQAVLRRSRALPEEGVDVVQGVLCFSGWRLDTTHRRLLDPGGTVVPLSGGEYRLLLALLERAGRVLSRDQLLELTRGRQAAPFDRAIDVQVGRLRRRLRQDPTSTPELGVAEPEIIKTVRGEGYVLAVPVTREG